VISLLAKEVLASVDVIKDPYVKAVTYARIGERLAKAGNPLYKEAFLKAVDVAEGIENPVLMLKALLSLGYSMRKVGIKAYGKIYKKVMESIADLPPAAADEVLETAVMYAISLGRIDEGIEYAIAIQNQSLKDNALLAIVRRNTSLIEKERIKIAYRIRKSKLAIEYIKDEATKSKALLEVIRSYILMGSYTNAIAIMKEITRGEWVKQAFKEVVMKLSSKGVLNEYAESLVGVAQELIRKFDADFRVELAIAFSIAGEGRKAVELIKIKKEDPLPDLIDVARKLFEIDKSALVSFMKGLRVQEAREVGKVVLNMVLESTESVDPMFVVSVAKLSRSEEVWVKAARYLVQVGNVNEAWKIANSLRSDKLRSIVLASIAHRLVREGKIERAIDAALEVRDSKVSSMLVAEILVGAMDTVNVKEKVTEDG